MENVGPRSRKALSALVVLLNHIKRFGYIDGLSIFLKTNFKKSGTVEVKIPQLPHPIQLRCGTSDIQTFWQVLVNLDYEFDLDFNPEFIIDCGANIGLASLFFIQKYPKSKIISIEPEVSNYTVLKENLKPYPNAIPFQVGIWNKVANLAVVDEYHIGNWAFTVKEVAEKTTETVSAITITDIMNKYNKSEIDLLKIDIEGSETILFSSDYESWLPYTKVIVIELHDWLTRGSSHSVLEAINKYDFSVLIRGENLIFIRNS